jgi:hypothetical protein
VPAHGRHVAQRAIASHENGTAAQGRLERQQHVVSVDEQNLPVESVRIDLGRAPVATGLVGGSTALHGFTLAIAKTVPISDEFEPCFLGIAARQQPR